MIEKTEETVEIKAGELNLNVPFTPEGMKVVQAMVKLLGLQVGVAETVENPVEGEGAAQTNPTKPFSLPNSSPMQRIKFKGWEAIGRGRTGLIYKEVVNRLLEEYTDGIEPENETFSKVIREMYGNHLKESSITTYLGVYKSYIREKKLAIKTPPQEEKFYLKGEELLPMEKVTEIWGLLPDEFGYKQVKALVPVSVMQSESRMAVTNYLIKQFLTIPEFGCEEPSAGMFVKRGSGER